MLSTWATRCGGWVCLGTIMCLCFFSHAAYLGQILLGVLAVLTLAVSGFERWRGKLPVGTGVAVAVFMAVFVSNAVFSVNPARTVTAWFFFFWLLASVPIGLAFVDTEPVRRWGLYALVAGMWLGVLLLLFKLWPPPSHWRGEQIMGHAGVLGLVLPVLVGHLLNRLCRPADAGDRRGRRLSWLLLLAANACLVGILLNGTRIVIISAVVTTLFLAAGHGRRLSRRAVLALLSLSLVAALTCVGWPRTLSRLASLAEFKPPAMSLSGDPLKPAAITDQPVFSPDPRSLSDDPEKTTAISNIWNRWWMWNQALKITAEHPFFGRGFRTIANNPTPAPVSGFRWQDGGRYNFHNTYLQLTAETGILGLLSCLGLFAPGLGLALKRFNDQDPDTRMWSRIAIALFLALAIHAATDNLLGLRVVPYLYGLLTAWAWARLSPAPAKPAP